MCYVTSIGAMRRAIARSGLRLNILRICARRACTINDLIHAPDYPGIRTSIFSLQSEINVSIELGECKARALLVRVGRVPDPIVPAGHTELLRTSILAFLLSPELCRAEPAAYEHYLRAWFSYPRVKDTLGADWAYTLSLFMAFPELANRAFYCGAAGGNGEQRRFGRYLFRDIPAAPRPPGLWRLVTALRREPLIVPGPPPARMGNRWFRRGLIRLLLRCRARPKGSGGGDIPIQDLAGPELLEMRLLPLRPW